jgi:hypothetical protein
MKKVLLAVVLFASVPAFAQYYHHHHYHGGYRGGWIAPAIIGGVIGYELSRPRTVIVEQQPVIVQQPPVIYQPKENCTAWIETMQPDGTITRTRTCTQ